jgi:DNA-binding NarL/FixJ family response regulator
LSESSVEKHVNAIFAKLGLSLITLLALVPARRGSRPGGAAARAWPPS